MSDLVYEWGRRGYAVPAKDVAEVIEAIAEREGGRCPPGRLVEAAAIKDSPLHHLFTWEDGKAASHWRTHEARKIIGSITVRYTVRDTETKGPAFLSVGHTLATMDRGEGYRPIRVVMGDPELKQEAIDEALARLDACRVRYASLGELAPVWDAVESVRPQKKKLPIHVA